jgi:hypothetical protein
VRNLASAKSLLPHFTQSRDKISCESAERAARLAIRLRRIYGGFAAVRRASPAAKRAYHTGIVKNQQGLDSELFPIGSGGGFALLNFSHSRDNLASAKSSLPHFSHIPVRNPVVKMPNVPRVWRFAFGESTAASPPSGGLRPPPNARSATVS